MEIYPHGGDGGENDEGDEMNNSVNETAFVVAAVLDMETYLPLGLSG